MRWLGLPGRGRRSWRCRPRATRRAHCGQQGGIAMAGVLSMIGAIAALFVLFPYILVMWRLTNAQRVVAFAVIGVVLLALSSHGFDLSHPLLDQFLQGIWSFVFFALMLGWF